MVPEADKGPPEEWAEVVRVRDRIDGRLEGQTEPSIEALLLMLLRIVDKRP